MYSQTINLAIALSLTCFHLHSAQTSNVTMSVCELMQKRYQLNGQIVRVRGVLQDSFPDARDPHFDELVEDNCEGTDSKQAKVQIVAPDVHFLANPPLSYKPDPESVKFFDNVLQKLLARGRPIKPLSVIVEGFLIVPSPEQDSSRQSRHRLYPGYIVLQAYRDVKVL